MCPNPKIIATGQLGGTRHWGERTTQPCPSPHTIEGQLDVACVQRSSPLVKAYDVGEVLKSCVHLHTEAPVLWAQQCVKARGTTGPRPKASGSGCKVFKPGLALK